ncbi:unnamed protein product [Trichobilharzia regenti]|nr:unnamed protein product [Trichobilharzia regenti]
MHPLPMESVKIKLHLTNRILRMHRVLQLSIIIIMILTINQLSPYQSPHRRQIRMMLSIQITSYDNHNNNNNNTK